MSDGVSIGVIISFTAGILTTLIGVAAKYWLDYRLTLRRLELDERAALSSVLGNTVGQLRRAAARVRDRVDTCFRDLKTTREWIVPATTPADDGYFLRSLTQRLFNVVTWSTVVQDSIDALPSGTLKARRDLYDLYARADVARLVLSDTPLFPEYPGYNSDRQGFHLFVGTVDAISDVGVRAYHTSDKTVPSSSFDKEYEDPDSPIQALRGWLGIIASDDPEAPVILARLACLRWVLSGLLGTDDSTSYGELSSAMQSISRFYDVAYKFDLHVSPVLTEMLSSSIGRAQHL
jgi:hypothetical protein